MRKIIELKIVVARIPSYVSTCQSYKYSKNNGRQKKFDVHNKSDPRGNRFVKGY